VIARLLLASSVVVLAGPAAAAGDRAAHEANELARRGTAAIEDRRFGDALRAFTRASALRPADASLCFGAGVAAFMLGQNDVAQAHFECALSRNPDHSAAAAWLGDLHYRAGRVRDAVAIYEAALERSPDRPDLRETLADWRKEVELHNSFREARSEHFTTLYEEATDEPVARDVLARLEVAHARVGRALGAHSPERIVVVLYTRDQFRDITKLNAWSAAGYDGRIRLPIGGTSPHAEELDRVLTHEYVHAVVAAIGGRAVPAWVNEGLATVLEPAGSGELEATLAAADVTPERVALHGSFAGFSRRDAEIAYASAARAVRQLIAQRGAPAVVALLQDLARGTPFETAFHQQMSMRYEDFAALVTRD
jgi:tetratricopeptide (TPR) repeat protein